MTRKYKEHSSEYLGEARDYWWNDDYLDLLASRLKLKDCQSLLDVGCGKGYMAFKLSKYLGKQACVYGLDAEAKWIREATQKTNILNQNPDIRFKFVQGDACHLPFSDNCIDITVCQTLLIHLKEPEKAIAEMVRVTKPRRLVVALEPNNFANSVVINNISELSMGIEQTLKKIEANLRMERGKMALGEGYNSLGDLVPEFFYRAGLKNIQVWLCDKPGALIPPYDTIEKKARRDEWLGWMNSKQAIYDYDECLRYYLAGGGNKPDFDAFWKTQEAEKIRMADALQKGEYVSAGGQMFYIVAGEKLA
jgi:ubiquinone/menaquinone biosynthesis C-methylase UbiE